MNRMIFVLAALILLFTVTVGANATVITSTLGNGTPTFNNGDTLGLIPDVLPAQSGQPAPFNQGIGNEVIGPDFSTSWTFSYSPILDPILFASIKIGIFDHDSAATGSQLGRFMVDGSDFQPEMNLLFEGGGGNDNQYNEYTVNLNAIMFAALADGSAFVELDLLGPGLQTALFGGGVSETAFNGAHLIFSTLSITTQDPNTNPIPEPTTMLLFGFGLISIARLNRKKAV